MLKSFIQMVLFMVIGAFPALAQSDFTVSKTSITEWKAVFGRVEAKDRVPARSRIGGVLVNVTVDEGDMVTEGQVIALIEDAKLDLQMQSVKSQIDALLSQLENAETELKRGEDLMQRGVTTAQRLDALRTQVNVLKNQIESTRAQERVIEQQAAEGAVRAPIAGRVLSVPVTTGSVVLPGEAVAEIAGGGFYLRLAVPERHAEFLKPGLEIQVGQEGNVQAGKLAKVYPLIENGRVIADVDVDGLNSDFVDARVLVHLPVGTDDAILVPQAMTQTRRGLDFVTLKSTDGGTLQRTVVLGRTHDISGILMIEVLSGLAENDIVVAPHEG